MENKYIISGGELYHYGRKGMKWYQRIFSKEQRVAAKKAKEKAKAEETKAKAKAAKEEYEARKAKALKSGSAKDILAFKGNLTKEEMKNAMERIQWEQNMKAISDSEVSSGQQKADKFFNGVGKATDYAVTSLKAYNTFANVYNALTGTDKPQLPTVKVDNTKDNRKERREEKKLFDKAKKESKANAAKEAAERQAEQDAEKAAKAERKAQKKAAKAEQKAQKNPDVSGEGTSKFTGWKSEKNQKVYDAVWEDISDTPVRSVSSESVSAGRSYVAGLLEAPRRR